MSQNFSLSISNPAAMGQDTQNVAYINAPGGNTLNLTLISRSSSIITIDTSDKDKFILKIPVEMLSSTDVRTDEAWTITLDSNDGHYYCFRLIPAGGTAIFKMEIPLLISLPGVQVNPALTTGKVENITVEYTQDGEEVLSANTYLIVCSLPPQTGVKNPLLIGADGLLTLSVLMNGQEGNPLIVSPAPTTSDNCLENAIQVNLVYQGPGATDDTYPANPPKSWDDSTRPTLKIYFPYTGQAQFVPDALCLTDTLQTGDPGFNKLTAADQIVYSLMPPSGDPDHTNTAWKIEMASDSTSTVWTLTPLSDNSTCLFTKGEASGDPGPILNVFFSQVVSNLPILEEYPQTLLYLDWKNFPGYTDGMLVYSIRKEQLSISDFSGTIHLDESSTKILFDWQTVNADHCTITGDTAWQKPNTDSAYVEIITPLLPMQPVYTLTAVGKGGVSATSSVGIGWEINTTTAKTRSSIPQQVFVRPAEDQIIILDYGQILFLNATTLGIMQVLPGKDWASIQMTQNGAVLFSADTGAVYKYDIGSLQLLGKTVINYDSRKTLLAANSDGSVIGALTIRDGKNIFSAISAATMIPQTNSPVYTDALSLAIQPQTGRYYLSSADHIDVLDPDSLQPVPGSPIPIANADVIAFSSDHDGSVYILSGDNPGASLSKVDGTTLRVVKSVTVNNAWAKMINNLGATMTARPGNVLMLSPDGSELFLAGSTGQDWDIPSASFSVFDPATLTQAPWQIGTTPDFMITGMALAPLSYRIFVTGVSLQNHNGIIFSIDAGFSVTA